MRPCYYHLENGEKTPAIEVEKNKLIVDLSTEEGLKVIGLDGWFDQDYVNFWNGLVPEWCEEGTEPGQYTLKENNEYSRPC